MISLSCQRDDNLKVGEDFLEDNSYAVLIDTVSLQTSTILMDSIITSGGGVLMVGKMYDGEFGQINVRSCFQIGPPEFADHNLHESATYDSMVLELIHNGYYYGDTLSNQTIEVYALNEEITAHDDGNLYNSTAFAIQSECMGRCSYRPSPTSGKTVSVRLSEEFGQEIFQLIQEGDDILTDQEAFLDHFKGLMLTAGDDAGSCVVGFIAGEGDITVNEFEEIIEEPRLLMRLFYHDNTTESEKEHIELGLINKELQYNQIMIDRSGTTVDTILAGDQRLNSQQTNNLTFIQGGLGIMSCIEFPHFDNLLLLGNNGMLVHARLQVKPLKGSYDDPYRLPESLNVWICNKKNEFIEPLYDYTGDTVRSTLYLDQEFDENTFYEIPITPFLQYELNSDLYTDYSLILTLPPNQMSYSLERMVIGGDDHPDQAMKLEMYYLFY
jgi:hypothetical protein